MTPNQFLHGFAGGMVGFMLAVPLTVHEGWMRMLKMRELHSKPITFYSFMGATALILPILLLIGVLASPLIAGYAAYQCGKESSLQPILATFLRPYETDNGYTSSQQKIGRSVLIGYSTMLLFTGFALLNLVTGGMFSLLAVPGAACIGFLGFNTHSILQMTAGALVLPYLTALFAGGATAVSQSDDEPLEVNQRNNEDGYRLLDCHDDDRTSTPSPSLSSSSTPMYDAKQHQDSEEIIYFGEPGSPNTSPNMSPRG